MQTAFSQVLTELRHQRGMSQKQAAADLGISQALLSHYENGAREPRLEFVMKVCDYYGVTADRLLGRVDAQDDSRQILAEAVEELLHRLNGMDPETASAVVACIRNATDMLKYMLDHPGQALVPDMLIREQQGFAQLLQAVREGT